MAENIRRVEKAGIARAYYYNLNSDGILIGTNTSYGDGDSIATPGRLKGIKTAEFPIPDVNRVQVTGDDSLLYEFLFEPTAAPSGTLGLGAEDLDFEALIQGTKVYAEGAWDMGVAYPADLAFSTRGLHIISRAASDDDGVTVSEGYWNRIIPNATIAPQGEAGASEQSAITSNYGMTINRATRLPYGRAFTDSDHGTTRAGYVKFWTENLFLMEAFAGDSTPVANLVLSQTPAGDDTTNKVAVFVWDGSTMTKKVKTTDFTVTPGTKTVAMQSGDEIATGEIAIVCYEHT